MESDGQLGSADRAAAAALTVRSLRRLTLLFCGVCAAFAESAAEARIRQLYDQGQWREAAEQAARVRPQSATTFLYQGLALARLKDFARAAIALRAGWEQKPRDARLAMEAAGVAYRLERRSEAKEWLGRALRLEPRDRYSNEFLGTLYLLDQNLPAGLKYLNRVGKPLISSVQFEPGPAFRPVLQARLFPISGGQVLSVRRFDEIEANARRVNATGAVEVSLGAVDALTVRTEPRTPVLGGWLGQALPALRTLPYQAVSPEWWNAGRRGINILSIARWDADKRRVGMRVESPLQSNPRTELNVWIDARQERWDLRALGPAFGGAPVRTVEAAGQVTFGLSERLDWTVGLRAVARDYIDLRRNRKAGASGEIDNRFDMRLWRWAERRIEAHGWTALRSGRFSDSRLLGVEGGVRGTWYPEARDDRYSVRSSFSTARLWGNAPVDELYIAGMERDNRPEFWMRGHPGARDGRKGTAPLGQAIAVGQLDAVRRLFSVPFVRVHAGPWFDFGRTGAAGVRGLSSQRWVYDTGAEAQVRIAGGLKLRVIYGRDLVGGRGVFYTAFGR